MYNHESMKCLHACKVLHVHEEFPIQNRVPIIFTSTHYLSCESTPSTRTLETIKVKAGPRGSSQAKDCLETLGTD